MEEVASLSRENINPGGHSQEIFEHFSIPAFDQDRLPILDHGGSVKSNKFLVQESSILLSKLNPKIPRVWLPFPRRTYRAIASTEFLVLIPRRPFTREFLYCLYTSPDFAGLFAGRALGTSTSHQRVKPEDFLRMDVVVPSDDQVLRFTAQVAPMLSAGNTLRLKNANLRRTRELLLPKLISGELDVSDLDINVGDAAA
jgi:type I restriction enzyme S subunit